MHWREWINSKYCTDNDFTISYHSDLDNGKEYVWYKCTDYSKYDGRVYYDSSPQVASDTIIADGEYLDYAD